MSSPTDTRERDLEFLRTGRYSDCSFIVGVKPDHRVIKAHKIILAKASPVFEAMFYGNMAEGGEVFIQDAEPNIFQILLECIYSNFTYFTSLDQAYEVCYLAKKYIIPHLVEKCIKYVEVNCPPNGACKAYEFAKLFEASTLMHESLAMMRNQTKAVLEGALETAELNTVITLFEQEYLAIDTELVLFDFLEKYAMKHNLSAETTTGSSPTVQDALKKIRFLTLTPQQFTKYPAKSKLMTDSEKLAILMNCSEVSSTPLPDDFSTSTVPRPMAIAPAPPTIRRMFGTISSSCPYRRQ